MPINAMIRLITLLMVISVALLTTDCLAMTIAPRTIIDHDTVYDQAELNLQSGSFIVTNRATLTIKNSRITGEISKTHPFLIQLQQGRLLLDHNQVLIRAVSIKPFPLAPPLHYAINLQHGAAVISHNMFKATPFYSIGLLNTIKQPTIEILFTHNEVNGFHAGLLLQRVDHARITHNRFYRVSSSNVFVIHGRQSIIANNTFLFAGNNNVGDAIDVADADDTTITRNYIGSGSCYSIMLFGCHGAVISHNHVVSGVTYAIYLTSSYPIFSSLHVHHDELGVTPTIGNNTHITITHNYLAQNRFGLAASHVDGMTVADNIFIQQFPNAKRRLFWTDNRHLLSEITHLTWQRNRYKEAYSQETADGYPADVLVPFPQWGGVPLPTTHHH